MQFKIQPFNSIFIIQCIFTILQWCNRLAGVKARNRFMFGNMLGGFLSGIFAHMSGANEDNDINEGLTNW
jgi:hypothetical protein